MTTAIETSIQPAGAALNADALLERIGKLYTEPAWLTEYRRRAFQVFDTAPLPDQVTHLWRYTTPKQFVPSDGVTGLAAPAPDQRREFPPVLDRELAPESLAAAAYVREGLVWKTAIDTEAAKAGVLIMDLHEAATQKPELIQQYLGQLVGADFGKFEAYINAAWAGGLLIYVPKGVQLDRPVHVVTAQPRNVTESSGRLLVVIEEGASMTLIDEYGEGTEIDSNPVRTNAIVETFVGRNARFTYAPVQNWNRQTISYYTQRLRLDADAKADTILTAVGGKTSKVDSGAFLAAAGAENNIYGLTIGDRDQHFDNHTVHEHQSGRTHSDLKLKVALRDEANSVYTGLIRIDESAEFCEAYQENRNLLLSPSAKAETIPELEILNNEVRCSHGATVGKVDEQEVFYCESRGIDRAEAIRLIVTGFVEPIVAHIPDIARDRLRDVILRRMEGS